jgi:hypothetical protein
MSGWKPKPREFTHPARSVPRQRGYGSESEICRAVANLLDRRSAITAGPGSEDDISSFEETFGVRLPEDFYDFLREHGALRFSGNFHILGLGDSSRVGPSVEDVTLLLRLEWGMPGNFVPIEDLGGNAFACLNCDKLDYGTIWKITRNKEATESKPEFLARSFTSYFLERLNAPKNKASHAMEILRGHIQEYQRKFNYDHSRGGKLPRNHDWRPYRFCIQDVVFGSTVVRHSKEHNCLEVDVFLPAEIPNYEPLAGARALTTFLLSEAFKCGGSMEIRFTDKVTNHKIPEALRELANRSGVAIANSNTIAPDEAKLLYLALTAFSVDLQERIQSLESSGKLNSVRACYVVHHGIWTREQVEMIVLGSAVPDVVLSGTVQPHERHLYQHSILHARSALLAGGLDRYLRQKKRSSDGEKTIELEDNLREFSARFQAASNSLVFQSNEPLVMPWLRQEQQVEIPANIPLIVIVRARDEIELVRHFEADLVTAERIIAETNQPVFVLVPADFRALPKSIMARFERKMKSIGIEAMISPEFVANLDSEAAQKLARSRIIRQ